MLTTLKPGVLVDFKPPAMAYSAESRQQQYAGQSGTVYHVWNDGYAHVTFGHKQMVLCNTAYLFDATITPSSAGRGWGKWKGYS